MEAESRIDLSSEQVAGQQQAKQPHQAEDFSMLDVDSDEVFSSEGEGEAVPTSFFGGYETIPEGESDEDDDEMALDYGKLVEAEGLQYLVKTVPLGTKLEVFACSMGIVERIAILKPLNPKKLVDVDTLVVRPTDLTVIGKVLEVFGPVEAPLYSVLCQEQFLDDGSMASGKQFSFMVNQATLVDTVQLKAQKVTDADDVEGGREEFYSDDEEEARAKKAGSRKKRPAEVEPGELSE